MVARKLPGCHRSISSSSRSSERSQLDTRGCSVWYIAERARDSARTPAKLKSVGRRLHHLGVMIYGVARSLGVPIVTTDEGFDRVDDLAVENPRELYE